MSSRRAEDQGLGGRGGAVHGVRATGRQDRIRAGQGGDVAVQPGRVPATDDTIEGMGARPHGLVGTALPVGEVVAALVPGPRPVRDLVAAEPGLREDEVAWWYWAAARSSSWAGRARSRQRRAPDVVGRWSPTGPVSPSAIRVVEGQGVQRQVVRPELQRGVERGRPRRQRPSGMS